MDIHHIVHDISESKGALYVTSTADTLFEGFKWVIDSAVFITSTEDGKQILKMEMLD